MLNPVQIVDIGPNVKDLAENVVTGIVLIIFWYFMFRD